MSDLAPTPGQTVGPFFHYGLSYPRSSELAPPGHRNTIRLHGNVFDGAGAPVPDALIEVWQPDNTGTVVTNEGSLNRDDWTFTGWGRAATDAAGHYSLSTIAPGSVAPGQAPFFAVTIFARGLLDALFTRAYLPYGNLAGDALLGGLAEERRNTLICQSERSGYRFDIRLQGAQETVFLTYPRTQHD
ncbi:protocatechuate 3,4-dioxygenase subunit alpha [Mycolicibacterium phocaicum]|uniref:Protocatechuate 3,4-dioxygenase subunit alpha n=1 Tax=Mycolicibacterium phocaicum TaxID=319706 RepID=A0A7I7ZZ51_9MYCO|nr:protocatechuate 3,4-dioxygenase subunit alpha [Mycolicibacterium phocaicum]TLH64027.1 protocatechuate 3,4-dioxygenase subunit alpha [Mycolicibacterium phocaicum]BBZ58111.1 protocatechuate 3,4-dioxygenase subunit alpha [Mycolicibacterium phocaicum]